MRKSALLSTILDDYLGYPQSLAQSPKHALEDFCDFVVDWLNNKGVIGVGHSMGGLALRFNDQSELSLLPDANAPQQSITVGISGVTGRSGDKLPGSVVVNVTGG